MYDTGKVAFIGGGLDTGTPAPTNIVEIIDLTAPAPAWRMTGSMQFARRQHNAASWLMVRCWSPEERVEMASTIWIKTRRFTKPTLESNHRQVEYHGGRSGRPVLSLDRSPVAGWQSIGRWRRGYAPGINVANPSTDSHIDAQLFSPPYLFTGTPRPTIAGAPDAVWYDQPFEVQVPAAEKIVKVSWIRLASGTHSFDQNQRLNFLTFVAGAGKLTVTTPKNANVCPPGHYMLFVIDDTGVPSVAPIVQISGPQVAAPAASKALFNVVKPSPIEKDASFAKNGRPLVTIGITPTCPYRIQACWGGAKDALQRLSV